MAKTVRCAPSIGGRTAHFWYVTAKPGDPCDCGEEYLPIEKQGGRTAGR